ncbi:MULTISPECIES: SLC13 family permease [unclassified Pseudoclavibacter]|uniref:SLC13 family permease n=1 Tax=unclassified Pseudoclavibacter TaxID=2615177 RepID=UPI000CE8DB58|nr:MULTISPECIES: SLC13 family permease [unclassified Pseudoclavibacter]PPF78543.1 C4-dicarboxylate ABC transporter [Pseudoclavibacter sp. Z016]PPG01231.1 C4-dicarboxylate ABC transporter [Pseudoclavibacter sp. RFBI5]
MSSTEILPLIALIAMFVIATIFPINIGFLGFVGAFAVGAIYLGFDDKEILSAFPGSIVLTIVGVTYFFGMAKKNGTIDLLVNVCIRAVRGRVSLIPWVFFAVASFLTALGTFSPAAVALIAPAAMTFAARSRMSPLVMGIMTINGAHAGAFSPISVSGIIVRDLVEGNGLAIEPWSLFFASYGINTLLSILTVVVYAVASRVRTLEYTATGSITTAGAHDIDDEGPSKANRVQALTLALIAVILVLVLVFHLPISFIAIAAGVVLAFTDLKKQSDAIAGISWSTVLLVSGMITYVSILQELGTIDHLADMALLIGAPIVVALVLCYVIGLTSAFASSTALLTAIIPLAMPLLEMGALPIVGVVAALSISATVVDVSPFSTNGALVLANAQGIDRRVFYKHLLLNAVAVVAIAPLLCWLILVIIPNAVG